jgi:hypothetical protein
VWESAPGFCRLSVQRGAGNGGGGMLATSPCRNWGRRQGPLGQTAGNGAVCTATCRRWLWRQAPAGTGPGGTCHMSPGQGCRHSELVFFGKKFQRWSFLSFHWCRWSHMSKIPLFRELVVHQLVAARGSFARAPTRSCVRASGSAGLRLELPLP